jgi:signal transduction histidine kinase
MKCPRCQHENLTSQKFCGECASPLKEANPTARSYGDLKSAVDSLSRAQKEALEQQTATSEILRVISSSLTELQPVLDVVVKSALRFCGADDAIILRLDGENLRAVAHHGPIPVDFGLPVPCVPGTVGGRSVLERRAVHVTDLQAEAEEFPEGSAFAKRLGARTTLGVPLLREGSAVGTIQLRRAEVNPFTNKQIALLQTFADQAVIAIENVRLFNELEVRNHELTESLARQTATAEILRVISSSPTDIRPVFDAIAQSAAWLCEADDVIVLRVEGDVLRLVAHHGAIPASDLALVHGMLGGRTVIERRVVHVKDLQAERDEYPEGSAKAREYGHRTVLSVPLLREGVAIGNIQARRDEVRPFTDQQIALLQTFADQAVIAIENVRLFTELQEKNRALTQAHAHVSEALERQTATSEILRVISRSPTDTQPVFETIAASAARLCAARDAQVLRVDGDVLRLVAAYGSPSMPPVRSISRGHGVGRAVIDRQPIHVRDMAEAIRDFPETSAPQHGVQSIVAIPLLRNEVALGVIRVSRTQIEPFTEGQIALLQTFADQAVIAIENVRLFKELQASNREIGEKSRQLEVASQHKSEFLANMSHELRTPLNAIIGFSEVLAERMFGELNEKQDEYLKDIHASGQHLLSLINDILDLSKIEAGRMELESTDFDLPTAIDNALTLVRERAGRRGIALHQAADEGLGQIRGDERKIKQVLLNLLSNAIKFTPDGGRIDVQARAVDGSVEVSVSDTGVGIAPEDQEAIFEEFRQVGTAEKKVEGTGLGLALSRKFIELHGGRIWVRSQLGAGSTFTFTIPVPRGQ